MVMAKRLVKAWDIRIVRRPKTIEITRNRVLWGIDVPFTSITEKKQITETVPLLYVSVKLKSDSDPFLAHCEMTDKGYSIVMEQRQISGMVTKFGWEILETFRIDSMASEARFREVLGRMAPRETPKEYVADNAQMIGYIFCLKSNIPVSP